jgi:hypothetical protein
VLRVGKPVVRKSLGLGQAGVSKKRVLHTFWVSRQTETSIDWRRQGLNQANIFDQFSKLLVVVVLMMMMLVDERGFISHIIGTA